MYIFLTVIIVIAAILTTLFVLVQNSKGGGLASGFTSGNQVMGAPKTADFLEKTTWGLIATIALLSVFAAGIHKNDAAATAEESQVMEQATEAAEAMQQNATAAFGEDATAADAAEAPVEAPAAE